jgi:hypothetical protein
MLANLPDFSARFGNFTADLHRPSAFLHELLNFIANELPRWRDRPDRKNETSETILTSQLCAHLNSTARRSAGWDILQFRIEEPDEREKVRTIDLAPSACDATIWIEGRSYTDFDTLLPIECKRLPTPKGKKRDEREYVINCHATTGGIQRFKAGHHGAAHTLGAMIAYVQEESAMIWDKRVAEWINELVASDQRGWTAKDLLQLDHDDTHQRLTKFHSVHTREKGLPEIELRHLWVQMN